VDDDPAMRDVTAEYLGLEGYEVIRCATGRALLAKARWYSPPAVIVLDLVLSDMSGGQCLHALRASPWHHVPVIIFSAWNDPERLGLDAQSFVRKAADPIGLARSIDHLLRRGPHQAPRRSRSARLGHQRAGMMK
jgi:two-component system phosphate regulon response regulator OmpR